jgi:hypothetical protein
LRDRISDRESGLVLVRPSGFEPLTYGSGGPRFLSNSADKLAVPDRSCPIRVPFLPGRASAAAASGFMTPPRSPRATMPSV